MFNGYRKRTKISSKLVHIVQQISAGTQKSTCTANRLTYMYFYFNCFGIEK